MNHDRLIALTLAGLANTTVLDHGTDTDAPQTTSILATPDAYAVGSGAVEGS